jgi:hypothetical protein
MGAVVVVAEYWKVADTAQVYSAEDVADVAIAVEGS